MTLETFFEKFELFADAPNAVAKMRELVLQLAVQGKLVEQRPSELPAIKCIQRANKPLIDVALDRAIKTPAGWAALPLGCLIASNIGGGTPSKQNLDYWDGPIPWASVKDVQSDKYLVSTIDSITEKGLKSSSSNLIPPNRLIVVTRMGLGKLAINTIPIAINQDLRAIEPTNALNLDFAYLLLKSLKFIGSGMTVKGITVDQLHEMTVALPPLAEQKRIAAKVDDLMTLCARLEAQRKERDTRHVVLGRASLTRFAAAPTPANLNLLFHKSYDIAPADLRKTILTLAVQGKLVPQNLDDEPAEELLAGIEIERRHFADAHKFRSPVETPIDNPSAPFKIPATWNWCRLSSLFNAVTDGDHLPPPKSDSGIAFLTIGNITKGKLDFEGCRFVTDSYYRALADFRRPIRGDILYTVVGATYGRPALVETDRPFCVQRHIAILKPSQRMEVGFLMAVLQSPLVYEQATARTTGTAQPTIPLGSLRNFLTPLPPLAEQRRIVAKVDQLVAMVDHLEACLSSSRATAANLLDALVADLTIRV